MTTLSKIKEKIRVKRMELLKLRDDLQDIEAEAKYLAERCDQAIADLSHERS